MQDVTKEQFCCICVYNYVWAISNFLAMAGLLTVSFLIGDKVDLATTVVLFLTWLFSFVAFMISCVVVMRNCRTPYRIREDDKKEIATV